MIFWYSRIIIINNRYNQIGRMKKGKNQSLAERIKFFDFYKDLP